jgi:FXSXX-COOH protein
LPDLTDVDLRTLRAMDDPVLMAAVDQLLRDPREFREVWYVGEDPVGGGDVSGGRTFPAGLTRAVQGEESQG